MVEDTLVSGLTFLSTGPNGRIPAAGGLFHRDTRYLADFQVAVPDADISHLGAHQPRPWSRTLTFAESLGTVNETADPAWDPNGLVVTREQVLSDRFRDRITVTNHGAGTRSTAVDITFGVDFADIFEVRGTDAGIDRSITSRIDADAVTYEYTFTDAADADLRHEARIAFSTEPGELTDGRTTFPLSLEGESTASVTVTVTPSVEGPGLPLADSAARERDHPDSPRSAAPPPVSPLFPDAGAPIATGREAYDRTFARAGDELRALVAPTPHGPVPTAGVPWFNAVFGRDSLLTAMLTLPVAPDLAVGTLRFLADQQGETVDPTRKEAPGKIFHELRQGELARTNEIPHTPYYGSIDATPLWIIVLSELFRWTGDRSIVAELWDSFEQALGWVDETVEEVGDDPFLYHEVSAESGQYHGAWRDSAGSYLREDGTDAPSPIASVEVQGYVYDAWRRAAELLRERPDEVDVKDANDRADGYERRAATLQERFDETFWLPDRDFYAAATASDGTRIEAATSNVGQCLWSGIVPNGRAEKVVSTLQSPSLFSGWGLRTVGADEANYHPVSYHRGSVWPHDTALVTLGMAAYGYHEAADTVGTGLLDASTRCESHSLPEAFCGFDASQRPMAHPASCRPQAWAAAAPFGVLRALFDLQPTPDGEPTASWTPSGLALDAIDPIVDAWTPPVAFRSTGRSRDRTGTARFLDAASDATSRGER